VIEGRADFQVVLVFDVSRWGRFQDSDEAACYEFLCKRAGIRVHYCAEPFSNDGSPTSTFLKMVKRTMAAEYIRELSAKVLAGQCRLAANGLKLGGTSLLGLRRVLLDSEGKQKMVLRDGERKNIATDRVTYTLGPEEEVRLVLEIYSMFLDQNMSINRIARVLNERGLGNRNGNPWSHRTVSTVLTHPKYTGCAVFNMTSQKLRSKSIKNPREQWVLRPNSFPAIVAQDVFDRVQAKIENWVIRRSDERLLAELRAFIVTYGKPLQPTAHPADMASTSTYRHRFGGRMGAYDKIKYRPTRYTYGTLESRRRVAALTSDVMGQLRQGLENARLRFTEGRNAFRLRGRGYFQLTAARYYVTLTGRVRWTVRGRGLLPKSNLIVMRLQAGNETVRDFMLILDAPKTTWGYTIGDDLPDLAGAVLSSIDEVVAAIIAKPSAIRRSM
jgi:DNA invertase Pin-like site-specific DNA recombinase